MTQRTSEGQFSDVRWTQIHAANDQSTAPTLASATLYSALLQRANAQLHDRDAAHDAAVDSWLIIDRKYLKDGVASNTANLKATAMTVLQFAVRGTIRTRGRESRRFANGDHTQLVDQVAADPTSSWIERPDSIVELLPLAQQIIDNEDERNVVLSFINHVVTDGSAIDYVATVMADPRCEHLTYARITKCKQRGIGKIWSYIERHPDEFREILDVFEE